MLANLLKSAFKPNTRSYKNFGHKRQPIPGVTVLWHGFLTFTFIGMGINWDKIASFFFGENHGVEDSPWSVTPTIEEEVK